jgi:hypothetical protein
MFFDEWTVINIPRLESWKLSLQLWRNVFVMIIYCKSYNQISMLLTFAFDFHGLSVSTTSSEVRWRVWWFVSMPYWNVHSLSPNNIFKHPPPQPHQIGFVQCSCWKLWEKFFSFYVSYFFYTLLADIFIRYRSIKLFSGVSLFRFSSFFTTISYHFSPFQSLFHVWINLWSCCMLDFKVFSSMLELFDPHTTCVLLIGPLL